MKKIDETVASKEPLLSNESWDEVSINLALLSNETSTTADIDNDRSIVVGGSTPVRIAEPFLFDRTRDADQRSLMSWSDSDDENSRMNTHEFISPTPVMPSLSSKKRVRFKRHLHHPASNRSSVESSNLIKRGTGSNNSCSAYHTCRNRSNIKLDPFVRTRCGCRHPHSTNPDRTGWRSCARLTLHSLLLLLSLFVCAFIFNLNQQLQQMQSQLSDGKSHYFSTLFRLFHAGVLYLNLNYYLLYLYLYLTVCAALVFYKHDDINLHELRSAFVDLQSNCSDRFGTMSRLQRKFDSTTIVWNNLTRQVSVIKQNLASALVVHQFADLRKVRKSSLFLFF